MIELAAHRPNELAGTATGDHRPVGHAGRIAVELDKLRCGVVWMEQDIGGLDRMQCGDRCGRRPVPVDARAEVHTDPAAGIAPLSTEVEHGLPPGLRTFIECAC